MERNKIVKVVSGAVLIQIIPLVATLLSDEFNWSFTDFIFSWVMFSLAGLAYLFFTQKSTDSTKKLLIGMLVAIVFLYVWAEFAVGVFTNFGS